MPTNTWYVAYRRPDKPFDVYVRKTCTFPSELAAKAFAEQRLAEGCDVSAGTLNPHAPRRSIGPQQLVDWLEEGIPAARDRGLTEGL